MRILTPFYWWNEWIRGISLHRFFAKPFQSHFVLDWIELEFFVYNYVPLADFHNFFTFSGGSVLVACEEKIKFVTTRLVQFYVRYGFETFSAIWYFTHFAKCFSFSIFCQEHFVHFRRALPSPKILLFELITYVIYTFPMVIDFCSMKNVVSSYYRCIYRIT